MELFIKDKTNTYTLKWGDPIQTLSNQPTSYVSQYQGKDVLDVANMWN